MTDLCLPKNFDIDLGEYQEIGKRLLAWGKLWMGMSGVGMGASSGIR
jgi:hypothetical protein